MKDMLAYKGYFGSIHYNNDDRVFYGKIEFIRALVSYEGKAADSLVEAFEEAVEDYLVTCEGQGVEPEGVAQGARCPLRLLRRCLRAVLRESLRRQQSRG